LRGGSFIESCSTQARRARTAIRPRARGWQTPLRGKAGSVELRNQQGEVRIIWQATELEARLGRPDPQALQHAIAALLRDLVARLPPGRPLCLHSDDHPAYARALRDLRRDPRVPPIHHQVTSSKQRRTTSNPLFPVNLADLRIRHGQANHRRETIAFSKRLQAAMERMAVFTVWVNCIKRKSEKQDETTAAMQVGLLARPLSWSRILRRRLFPGHWKLSARWRAYYERKVKTPAFEGREARHTHKHAF